MVCQLRSGPPPHIALEDDVTLVNDHRIRRRAGLSVDAVGGQCWMSERLVKVSKAEMSLRIQTRPPRRLASTDPPCVSSRHGPSWLSGPRGSLAQRPGLALAWACLEDWPDSGPKGNHPRPLKPRVSPVRGCPAAAALAIWARVGCLSSAASAKVLHVGPPRPDLWRSLHPLNVVWRAGLA